MNNKGDNNPNVKVTLNGPYIVTGGVPLSRQIIATDDEGYSYRWHEDKKYELQNQYVLCRCGNSKNKPFCDGTHMKDTFDGTETANREPYLIQAERIEGPELDLTDAQELCASARFCDRAGGIWNLTQQSDEQEAKKIAIEEASNCPSGRLVIWNKRGEAIETDYEPSIVLVEDQQENVSGPIWVRGGIPIESADVKLYELRNDVTLCRCGKSCNKPFCDGSHIQID
ncbi:CDGSH iron-sulfur domain-containing protein [Chloroflexota bacterium]